jgi:hypothetical protein
MWEDGYISFEILEEVGSICLKAHITLIELDRGLTSYGWFCESHVIGMTSSERLSSSPEIGGGRC